MARQCPLRTTTYQSSFMPDPPVIGVSNAVQNGAAPRLVSRIVQPVNRIATLISDEDEEIRYDENGVRMCKITVFDQMTREVRRIMNDTKTKSLKAKVIVQLSLR
jgi:hypothetical protein